MDKLLVTLLLLFSALFYVQKQPFITDDLPRHLTNGRLILETLQIPTTNTYSYTHANFPTIMHHWGSGVIFWLITNYFSYEGLSVFSVTISLVTFAIAVSISWEKTTQKSLLLLGVLITLPTIVHRNLIRPEIFSYLFFVSFIWILERYISNRTFGKSIWLLPLFQVFWVNLHVFFIFGPILICLYLLIIVIQKKLFSYLDTKQLFLCLLLTILACLVNPFGLQGLTAPFSVSASTGAYITENLDVFTYLRYFDQSEFLHFLVVVMMCFWTLTRWYHQKKGNNLLPGVILLVFGLLGIKMVRTIVLFGYCLLIFSPPVLDSFFNQSVRWLTKSRLIIMARGLTVLIIIGSMINTTWYYSPFDANFGLGLVSSVKETTAFIHNNNIQGPIFNNFNIGGYLIYHFFPRHSVFIDQRPEAYPQEFITQTYIPLHNDDNLWNKLDQQHQFQTIILSINDASSEFSEFIKRRQRDADWQLRYKDQQIIVFSRTNS